MWVTLYLIYYIYIYIHKVCVCLFVCQFITFEPLDKFVSNFEELGRPTEKILAWFWDFNLSTPTCIGKIAKIEILQLGFQAKRKSRFAKKKFICDLFVSFLHFVCSREIRKFSFFSLNFASICIEKNSAKIC